MRKHFVQFFSPGTLFSETSSKPIDSWNVPLAVKMSWRIIERHEAKPYAFQFFTCLVVDPVPDGEGGTLEIQPKEVERSGSHFLGGELLFYDDLPDDDEHRILRSNMRGNGHPIAIQNKNSWCFTGNFCEGDCIVNADGAVVRKGTDADLVQYRRRKVAQFASERDHLK